MARSLPRGVRPYRRWAPAVPVLAVVGALLTACSGPPPARAPEVLPRVEAPYDRAVRKALDEVPGSRLVSVGLTDVSAPRPVWKTDVATADGTVHEVRLDAVRAQLINTSVPAGQSAAGKARTAALVGSAPLLPEEAVKKVKAPDFGKVNDVRLEKGPDGRTVWSVTVTTIERGHTRTYEIDAAGGKVVESSTAAPSASAASAASGPSGVPGVPGTSGVPGAAVRVAV